ncbi:BlyA family holin (plasmid) [Borrelia puertoricensis]|uniref:BlyA family holin n=1 Tax=Borrelia puertoricensis TaxID=2756107 RepID=UPI001FF3CD26|nr:BlyA family holin [Borrelia puertoricensis]UPA18381.1 BlyA family holin [Borrelia puertoricensis]UPA18419.1 BlyA family holin [Borrelia puertoricensis]UPA18459.1 BlyA family holin [Borrelia puertoricensis]UPA18498.1 BlyA family holin [Borrelia puertoricensis]UPA18540.1 BlyA family holin [Borrelia puertoricensis]
MDHFTLTKLSEISELLININEIKLIVIATFILGIGLIFKPVIKDIISLLATKFKRKHKGKD